MLRQSRVHHANRPLDFVMDRTAAERNRLSRSLGAGLSKYHYKLEYRKGMSIKVNDVLSRAAFAGTSHQTPKVLIVTRATSPEAQWTIGRSTISCRIQERIRPPIEDKTSAEATTGQPR